MRGSTFPESTPCPQSALVVFAAAAAVAAVRPARGGRNHRRQPRPRVQLHLPERRRAPALDCYLDAVEHLYTMCRHVKSIEIIEFGYEKSTEGTQRRQERVLRRQAEAQHHAPYQAALHEATVSKQAVDAVRACRTIWLASLAELEWRPGEIDEAYKARTRSPTRCSRSASPAIKEIMAIVKARTTPAPAAAQARRPNAERRRRSTGRAAACRSGARRDLRRRRRARPRASRLPLSPAAARDGRCRRARDRRRARR